MQDKKNKGRFGVLMKYAIKDSWKGIVIGNGAFVVGAILLSLLVRVLSVTFMTSTFGAFLITSLFFAVGMIFIVGVCLVIANLIKTLYQKLFTNEGYLTFTLPVTTDELIFSRILTNLIWATTTTLATVIAVVLGALIMADKIQFLEVFYYATLLLGDNIVMIICEVIMWLVNYVIDVLIIILSLAISRSSIKEKGRNVVAILIACAMFYALNLVSQASELIGIGWGMTINGDIVFSAFHSNNVLGYVFNITAFVLDCGIAVGLYFATRHMLSNKLELT